MLKADQGWFSIAVEGGPEFEVYEFSGREKLNEPYEFSVEVVSHEKALDLVDLLGRQALLLLADHSWGKRKVHGSIREAQRLHTGNHFTHYRLTVVPRLWYLGQNCNHRIFQHKSVLEIIDEIMKEQRFRADQWAWKLQARKQYEPREYCVQYGESDLYFISRLCEEEGIYYYFEHEDANHILCFSNAAGGPWIPGQPEGLLRFHPGAGMVADEAVLRRLGLRRQALSDRSTYREWNFEEPPLDLEVSENEPDQEKAPLPGGLKTETYQFPHLYEQKEPGQRYAQIQLLRQLTFSRLIEGESDVTRLLPGFAFSIYEHPRKEVNDQWWLTEVQHKGEQPQVLEHEAPDRGFSYLNSFTAIPFQTRFVSEIKHPTKRVGGLQSAIVTGSEEVYVDEYGRVKAHFHWDRLGPFDESSSRWVRVADSWAGGNFGFIQAPRQGQELMVEYMEGDPDRPVATSRVYNADLMPPWQLPEQRALSGIQSREFGAAQRNQMVLDDTERQVQAQMSSDHDLSQLNLGYITRVEHVDGRADFRGEGFELRTDAWGTLRAAKGILATTYARLKGEKHHKDMGETLALIEKAAKQHKDQAETAASCQAQPDEPAESSATLDKQKEEVKGSGSPHGELAAPHLVFSGPAGLALTAADSIHLGTGTDILLTAGKTLAKAAGQSYAVSALRRVTLFALKAGMKLFAGNEKLEIQAQSDDMDVIADKVIKIISAKEKIHISGAEEVLLTAGESYIQLKDGLIKTGTNGKFTAYAASHDLIGPKTMPPLKPGLPEGLCPACMAALAYGADNEAPFCGSCAGEG
jgi:type VI secretion system secreted protein VgrG